eukprot:maker-scaffold12_size759060-snap-gene-6.20 protein:Tk05591 transcript:maker-scaffold12_size759060-snap-gene-6.20-mRNA-1 annotation:"neuropeptides capa receptor"
MWWSGFSILLILSIMCPLPQSLLALDDTTLSLRQLRRDLEYVRDGIRHLVHISHDMTPFLKLLVKDVHGISENLLNHAEDDPLGGHEKLFRAINMRSKIKAMANSSLTLFCQDPQSSNGSKSPGEKTFTRHDFWEVELQSQDSISMLCKSNANLEIYEDPDQPPVESQIPDEMALSDFEKIERVDLMSDLESICILESLDISSGLNASSQESDPRVLKDGGQVFLCLPNDLAIYWQQYPWMLGEAMCKGRSLVSEMTSYSSVLIIVSFSMERYLAICHPLYSHTMSGFKRAVRIIAMVWLISMVFAIPYAIFTRLNYIDRPLNSGNFLEESAFCALLDDNIYPKSYPVHQVSSFLFFIFPMGILVILYIRMGFRIRQTTAVVFAFFLCWAPFHAQRLSYVYFKESLIFRTINEYLYYVSGFLYYLSATVNPILYNLMSLKYRHAFRQTLCGKGVGSRRRRPGTVNRSYTFRSTTRTGGMGRRVRSFSGKSEFRKAMSLANAACPDIVEEDSQVSSSGAARVSHHSVASPCCSVSIEQGEVRFILDLSNLNPAIPGSSLKTSKSPSPKPRTVDTSSQTPTVDPSFIVNCPCYPGANFLLPALECRGQCNNLAGDEPLPGEPIQLFGALVKVDDDQDSGNGSVTELQSLLDREARSSQGVIDMEDTDR